MKYLFLLALLVLCPRARAQTAPVPAGPVVYRYCTLVVDDRLFASPGNPRLYYGRLSAKAPADETLEAAEKQIRKANDILFALNYLSSLGWECFNVTTVSTTNTRGNIDAETRYLFRQVKP